MPLDSVVAKLIARHRLTPHPEGGWFCETSRWEPKTPGRRSPRTRIDFLLPAGERSHWHRIDAAETWRFSAGAPLELRVSRDGEAIETHLLGRAHLGGKPQRMVRRGYWQSAVSTGAWTLVTCDCRPGFEFSGFELAPPGWEPAGA